MQTNLIFEELSISNEILSLGQNLKQQILQLANQKESNAEYFKGKYIQHKFLNINLNEPIFNLIDTLYVSITFFQSLQDYYNIGNNFNFYGETNLDNKSITLRIVGIDSQINEKMLASFLNHELKHAFQESLYKNSDVSNLYKLANNIINNQNNNNYQWYIYDIAFLLYFYDKNEINANMESLYQELLNTNDTEHINTLVEYNKTKQILNNVKKLIIDKDATNDISNTFHKSLKQLLNYISHRIDYFNTRKYKVLMKIKNEKQLQENIKKHFNRFYLI